MPFARSADDVQLHYQVSGSGEPLLLLSGQANNLHWWDRVRPDFEREFTTVVLDHRGTGLSGKPEGGYATRTFAEDALSVLDDLGVDRCHVYGTSMGGRVAQWLAADHPERVRGLVLGCTSPGPPHGVERSAEVRRSLAQPDRLKARRALLELMYTPAWLERHDEPFTAHGGPFTTLGDPDMPPHARKGHLLASGNHNSWDALPSITAPTLVVHGTDDEFNPTANAPLLAKRIPDTRLHLVEGARHAYFEEFHHETGPLVADFLDAH
ncbi:alpha/beta fold hydrolase [Actinosynnema pretiosum subsp. pretiosum]|uniref:Alpha/beta fold hydrolase n=1 Tax=Actinosynnema pretiosum subsp. pretiosum TaxID=103721 RepID=A0AA45R4A6_9PSEU|nr:Beta-ketoadipate enol-lactone hydrolase [Actinosynnema pretiosum subsp. pretiosum]QUF04579.1 alpha/beta fold hydrolase [Actinosynnema pretiosum subsp. pretiosum]